MESACESAQTERAIHPRSTKKPMVRHTSSSRARGFIRETDTEDHYQKKSPKKPINRVCPCEESTDEHIDRLGQGRLMVHKEYYMEILPGEWASHVKSTWFGLTSWGPVTEARPLPVHGSTPGTCHC